MMEPNDYPVFPFEQETEQPAGRRHRRAKHLKTRNAENLYRLGMSCLALLLVTALVLVNGSFSQYSSQSSTGAKGEGTPTLTVAAFNVMVDASGDYSPSDQYKEGGNDYDYVAYAFDVFNESDVPVKCNINLNIAVSYEGEDLMQSLIFSLYDNEGNVIKTFDETLEAKNTPIVLSYDSETEGGTFYLDARDSGGNTQKTFVLVMDCSGTSTGGMDTEGNLLYLSNNNPDNDPDIHAITVTAEQATEEVY